MAGEELFNTDVNSQNTGYDQNNPVAGNIVGNSASTNPLDSDALKLLTTYLSQTNVPQASTTLPPQYYYPGQQGVAIGQMSGPMGSLTTYSPGQALFPMSVLDAVEKENKAMRQKAIEEQFKPIDYDYTQLDFDSWNDEWFKYQVAKWDGLKNDYLEKAGGDWAIARKLMERDGAIKKTAAELNMLRQGINTAYADANGVIKAFESGDEYTDQDSYNAAKALIESSNAGGSFDEKFDDIQKARRDFWTARSIHNASEDIVAAASKSINTKVEYEIAKYAQRDANGNITNMAEIKDMINKLYQQEEQTGLYGFKDPNELNAMIDASWEENYGADSKSAVKIPKEKYAEIVKSKILRANKFNVQKITDTDAWIQAAANYQYDFRPIDEVSGVTSDVPTTDGLKTKEINVLGLSSGLTGNSFTGLNARIWDANKGKWVNKNISGSINSRISYIDKIGVDKKTGKPIYGKVYQYVINVEAGEDADGNKQYKQVIASSNTSIDGTFQETLIKNKMRVGKEGSGYIQTKTPEGGTFSSKTQSEF